MPQQTATRNACPKSSAVSGLYGRLSFAVVRANTRLYWLGSHHFYNASLCPRQLGLQYYVVVFLS